MGNKRWLLVANQSAARLFEVNADTPRLREIEDFTNPSGRLHDGDLDADRGGRTFDSAGEGRHAMTREQSATGQAADAFARDLAARLAAGRKADDCGALLLVAEPRFLGRLRAMLDDATAALVRDTLDKDLTRLDAAALADRLDELLRPSRPR
ncbi:MAG: host attachment protein [Gammaproteobacteria bacterium]